MKTSHILLAILAFVTLTGMVATDVLLRKQYDKINWSDPYQTFERRALPMATHWVVEGNTTNEIIIERSAGKPQALIEPDQTKFYQTRQQGDTVFVMFTPDLSNYEASPRDDANHVWGVRLVLRLPDFQTLRIKNARLTLQELAMDKLTVSLQKSRLRTNKLQISDSFSLTGSQNSFAVLGPEDRYQSLQMTVQDSSGIQLNSDQITAFTKNVSPKAEVQLRGQALKWLK